MDEVSVADIAVDPRCQPRAAIDPRIVAEYAEEMADGAVFPPLTVYDDGERLWLADGFHRLEAAKSLGLARVMCEIRRGTLRDAILHACGANASHGLRRTNADKRRAVETLLRDPEWSQWSDYEIARRCAVSDDLVRRMRNLTIRGDLSLPFSGSDNDSRFVRYRDRWGQERTMAVTGIGRSRQDHDAAAESDSNGDETGDLLPPADQAHSISLAPPPPRAVEAATAFDQDDIMAFLALESLAKHVDRDPDRVAMAGHTVAANMAAALHEASPRILIWIRDVLEALGQ